MASFKKTKIETVEKFYRFLWLDLALLLTCKVAQVDILAFYRPVTFNYIIKISCHPKYNPLNLTSNHLLST